MPALIPVDNTLGALFIGAVLSSILYGVTWLQVYSYYNSHCSRDRWPLKTFVAFLMLVDSANLVFVTCTTYQFSVTNFGDYQSNAFVSWSQPATALSAVCLEVSVQNFYAYRIYRLGRGSLYLPLTISIISLTSFARGLVYVSPFYSFSCGSLRPSSSSVYNARVLKHIHAPGNHFHGFFIAGLSCKVLGDVLITVGMVYYLLSGHTQARRINNVLNLLAIYAINCGTLNLVFAVSCVTLLAKYQNTYIFAPSLFITIRLSLCAFMSILNSRDYLREMLDGPEGVVTFTQLKVRTATTVPWGAQDTAEANTDATVPKRPPPASVISDTPFSDSVIALDSGRYPAPPIAEVVTV
ncbi:hypothetical protein H4582DRAFT_1510918 [Lactarius indigo]|nr:hypothetical protein H4582DRAFT_1510918 [Lactarius indigo]